ncbi:MAG: 50S ribosomal protein L22 [Candidatus Veblenbacteria bacterium]|nr:50S ribosomal protein L22 [Candidatus Veblenbacteria bacterium]MDZ4229626.1 50S ribosomal protein L22 [Candidatus Veblenbacteria bacterium]
MEVRAKLMNLRASPRKLKLVVDLVRGRKLTEALRQLDAMPQGVARPVAKLLRSAAANAKNNHKLESELWLTRVEVGQGQVLKRWRPAAHGSAHPIRRPTAHIKLVVSDVKPAAKSHAR